ncbi:aspartyl protease family protein [uncultured Psychroserpens sp.]|uniref:pepsin/retropepsin-like aspartic protease family protein n=1 Tax=uncultured Psychroserpens sp. TaxID=255436 RepID=UPI00262C0BB4|nr:aspartyl protease family protein [uncultured Psychroserpens sp.]
MSKKITVILILLMISSYCLGQSNFNLPRSDSDRIHFKLIGNLIILPVEVNGVKLSFVLDSGVSKPILFNLANVDSLQIRHVEKIFLRGLGGGEPVEAMKSKNNFFRVGNAININQDIYVVFDSSLNFTPRLGTPIHGIVGYDLFKNFTVEINYASKYIELHKPETYKYKKCNKCETLDLSFYRNKPYITGEVLVDSQFIPVKLLIDTGSSDALWLFEDDSLGLTPFNDIYFEDFLGKGLSGNVFGKRSKIEAFKLKSFRLDNVNTAFPDSSAISYAKRFKERNGSISGELLKRFNLIVDYKNAKLTLKKNSNFKTPFYYNRSGIVLEQNGVIVVKEKEANKNMGYSSGTDNSRVQIDIVTNFKYSLKPAYTIVELREGSPAEKAGLQINDIILSINGKDTHLLALENVINYFKSKIGKLIKLKVDRQGTIMQFEFRLEDVFKQKELP